ncbi:MAG: DUF5103 domain-containing protein [Microscillaceae bacterium]|nr:DUF5103 domain-containing protein [Microscillaceae bacterium]
MKKCIFRILCLCFLPACLPLPSSNSGLENTSLPVFKTEDLNYSPSVKTVLFYPEASRQEQSGILKPPVIFLNQSNPLVLEFDDLDEEIYDYRAKIIHCNFDWTESLLNDIEFINAFNDFQIRDRQLSFSQRVPFVHYRFVVPKLKISGNYVIKIYRSTDENDLVLSRRFVVYENQVSIQPQVRFSNKPSERDKNQQIEFTINYSNYPLSNPRDEVKVLIRQNYRWDNALRDLVPTSIREFEKVLEYNHFNLENNFKGLNEFRRFDIKSIRFLGFQVANLDVTDSLVRADLYQDQPRAEKPYIRQNDSNGGFYIYQYETGQGTLEAEYVKVTFSIKSEEPRTRPVYVLGKFNGWIAGEDNRMRYQESKEIYSAEMWVKQGDYDYVYAELDEEKNIWDFSYFEGAFQETENDYDVLVYYRPIGARSDLVIGYKDFNSNTSR